MRYSAIALQTLCDSLNQDSSPEDAQARMGRAIDRVTGNIVSSQAFLTGFNGYPVKLIVLPEYWLSGFIVGESRAEWRAKAAIDMDGKIADRISEMAQKAGVFLCSNHYENDPNFPELFFQSSVIYAPSGDAILRYRRMISLYTPSPYDVWDKYLELYGEDAIFPVADTEIGVLATIASEEILYPEIARMVAFKGAEILLHSTSEIASPTPTAKHICKHARAMENTAYVISANTGSITGTPVTDNCIDGMSIIIDHRGRPLAEAGLGVTHNANAIIDLSGLRDARRQTGMSNTLSRLPNQAFAQSYQTAEHARPNRTRDGKMIERADANRLQESVIDALVQRGAFK